MVSYDVYVGRWTQVGSILSSQHPRHVVENLWNDNILRSSTLWLSDAPGWGVSTASLHTRLKHICDSSYVQSVPRSCALSLKVKIFSIHLKNDKKRDRGRSLSPQELSLRNAYNIIITLAEFLLCSRASRWLSIWKYVPKIFRLQWNPDC